MNYVCTDRRKYQRLKVNLGVSYAVSAPTYVRVWFGDRQIEATMIDLCEKGMALVTSYDIPESTVLEITIRLFRMGRDGLVRYFEPAAITGQVRSNTVMGIKEYRLGICFDGEERQRPGLRLVGEFIRAVAAG